MPKNSEFPSWPHPMTKNNVSVWVQVFLLLLFLIGASVYLPVEKKIVSPLDYGGNEHILLEPKYLNSKWKLWRFDNKTEINFSLCAMLPIPDRKLGSKSLKLNTTKLVHGRMNIARMHYHSEITFFFSSTFTFEWDNSSSISFRYAKLFRYCVGILH